MNGTLQDSVRRKHRLNSTLYLRGLHLHARRDLKDPCARGPTEPDPSGMAIN
jgi:hypothetical protein